MASPLQTPSGQRKIIYCGLILGVFVLNTFFLRGVSSPLTGDRPPAWTVTGQANALDLTEETQGESDLLGSTVRLVLTGSRGLAVTVLWNSAIEKQKRNEWNELEFLVRSLTKLQPHFLTPWLFQSWNLSYNVSVESDRVKDKYFYISRGIELLAEGERLNKDNPDMRYWLGFYYQNKFGVSDEANSLRSLYQLSCIPPEKRNPDVLAPKDANGRRQVDLQKFEQFCSEHPQLVRRLREPRKELTRAFRCNSPEEVVEFLEANRRLPSRFVDPLDVKEKGELIAGKVGDLKPATQQFPVLPTTRPVRYNSRGQEPIATDTLDDNLFDGFVAARAWFSYAQDPLPDIEPMTDALDRPERIKQLKGRRLPRQPAEVLFRQAPCRAQSYVAEWIQKEGWYDDSGWAIDGNRTGRDRWFPNRPNLVVGGGKDWATEAWERAFLMWREFGEGSGMLFPPGPEESNTVALARKFQEQFLVNKSDLATSFRPEEMDPEMRQAFKAHRRLVLQAQNRHMTNFMHHFWKAEAEKDRDTAKARKTLARARQFAGDPEEAILAYEDGYKQWKAVLLKYPNFREDEYTQEELCETEVAPGRYLDLIREHRAELLRQWLAFQGMATAASAATTGVGSPATAVAGMLYRVVNDPRVLPIPVVGPLDVAEVIKDPATGAETTVQWIKPDVATSMRVKYNLQDEPKGPEVPPSPGTVEIKPPPPPP